MPMTCRSADAVPAHLDHAAAVALASGCPITLLELRAKSGVRGGSAATVQETPGLAQLVPARARCPGAVPLPRSPWIAPPNPSASDNRAAGMPTRECAAERPRRPTPDHRVFPGRTCTGGAPSSGPRDLWPPRTVADLCIHGLFAALRVRGRNALRVPVAGPGRDALKSGRPLTRPRVSPEPGGGGLTRPARFRVLRYHRSPPGRRASTRHHSCDDGPHRIPLGGPIGRGEVQQKNAP
jgi:hypothetical protein